jgi:hypothetical protein
VSLTSVSTSLASARVSSRSVGLFRIAIGFVAFLSGIENLAILAHVIEPGKARFPYGPLAWNLPQGAVEPIAIVWLTLAIAFTAGIATRAAGFGLAATMGFVLSVDQQLYSNHLYLLTLTVLLLTLADSGAGCSIDARRGRGGATVAAWPLLLLKLQLTIVYLFAAVTKINAGYLSGDILSATLRTDRVPFLPATWQTSTLYEVLAILSIATELFLMGALWSSRWRRVGLATAAGFHGMIVFLMADAISINFVIFSSEMIMLYSIFCSFSPTVIGGNLHRWTASSGWRQQWSRLGSATK